MNSTKKIFICVGDASADVYAADLAKLLQDKLPGVEIHGNGGKLMAAAGVKLNVNLVDYGVIGFSEVVKNYFKLIKIIDETATFIEENKFDLVILMDYPGFNLRLAKKLKKTNIKVVYYILPQIWAWGAGRIKQIKAYINKCFVVFPFEQELYSREGISVDFNGHPLVDMVSPSASKETLRKEFGLGTGDKVIGLFPGSRKRELETLLPVMLEAAKGFPEAKFLLCQAISVKDELILPKIKEAGLDVQIVKSRTYDVMAASDAVVLASGTVTLEAALMEKPMVIIYKVSAFTKFMGTLLLKIKYVTLPNIVAGKLIVPELIQKNANSERVILELRKLLSDTPERKTMLLELAKLRTGLGEKGVKERIAEGIMQCLK